MAASRMRSRVSQRRFGGAHSRAGACASAAVKAPRCLAAHPSMRSARLVALVAVRERARPAAAMNALAPTAPMKIGRCTAFRARAVSHTGRAIAAETRRSSAPLLRFSANGETSVAERSVHVLARTGPALGARKRRERSQHGSALVVLHTCWTTTTRSWLLDGDRALHPHGKGVACSGMDIRPA